MNVAKLRKLLATYDDDAEVLIESIDRIGARKIKEIHKDSCWTVIIETI